MAHQDDKLAKMRTDLAVTTGTINDLEAAYIATLWVSTGPDPVANREWGEFWQDIAGGSLGTGHWNDVAGKWLDSKIFTGNLTDQWAKWWAP
jgi:hypothetical protein